MFPPCVASFANSIHPPWESMGPEELDIMEILLLADYGGLPWDVDSIINTVRSSSEIQCFMKLTPWQKRQAEIAWLFDVSGCTDDATMRGLIRTLRAKLTPDERKSLLLAMRWMNWPFDTCPLQV